ncbi:Cap-specific mRNA (nucleoside-2'-O-)-methyltransferase 2 [Nymphon striatum]|nr:Cap-specific mRNA (nucleoside-2'-O-)-methyltransferase 2 [Nymphon striatum]
MLQKRNVYDQPTNKYSFQQHVREYANPESHFSKSYSFDSNVEWKLPETPFKLHKSWNVPDLLKLKSKLNAVKGNLSNKDIEIWHNHTSNCNVSAKIFPTLKRNVKPELATQAWCKFFEILHRYPLLDTKDDKRFFSIHLCEAPGAFISALNHFIKQNSSFDEIKWNWIGNSLNPYYEGSDIGTVITDDRLIRCTSEQWCFGSTNTGNILSNDIMPNIIEKMNNWHSVNLVTADGSIDCQVNPAEQECMVAELHLIEAITGVLILSPSGSLVLKMFTFYESNSVCLLYFLNCIFCTVHVFKPVTSKSGNSEVYVICEKLKKEIPQKESLLNLLKKISEKQVYGNEESVLFSQEDIPEDFIESVIECAQLFFNYQVSTIYFNLELFDENILTKYGQELDKLQNQCKKKFFKQHNIRRISNEKQIIKSKLPVIKAGLIKSLRSMSFDHRSNSEMYRNMLIERMRGMKNYTEQQFYSTSISLSSNDDLNNIILKPIFGKPFNDINVSVFCDECILNLKKECMKYNVINSSKDTSFHCDNDILEKLYLTYEESVWKKFSVIYVKSDLDNIQSKISDFLQKSFLNDMECDLPSPKLFFIEIFHSKFHSQPKLKTNLLCNISKVIQNSQNGDSLILLVEESLSRFVAGIIYILGTMFKKVSFIHSNDGNQSLSSIDLVLFSEMVNMSKNISFSQYFLELSSNEMSCDRTLLEILPTPHLLEGKFVSCKRFDLDRKKLNVFPFNMIEF